MSDRTGPGEVQDEYEYDGLLDWSWTLHSTPHITLFIALHYKSAQARDAMQ